MSSRCFPQSLRLGNESALQLNASPLQQLGRGALRMPFLSQEPNKSKPQKYHRLQKGKPQTLLPQRLVSCQRTPICLHQSATTLSFPFHRLSAGIVPEPSIGIQVQKVHLGLNRSVSFPL